MCIFRKTIPNLKYTGRTDPFMRAAGIYMLNYGHLGQIVIAQSAPCREYKLPKARGFIENTLFTYHRYTNITTSLDSQPAVAETTL